MQEITNLCAIHRKTKFPKDAYKEINGIDLVTLDSFAAGCIEAFLEHKGQLDLKRTSTLGLCYRDLGVVIPELQSGTLKYFSRLEKISKLVLESIRDTSKPID